MFMQIDQPFVQLSIEKFIAAVALLCDCTDFLKTSFGDGHIPLDWQRGNRIAQ
jgi:hypothetical protein